MMNLNTYIEWLESNGYTYDLQYRDDNPYSITAHLKNQFGEKVDKTFYVFANNTIA